MKEKILKITGKEVQISDGYHTFDELYDHRIELYITLCRKLTELWAESGAEAEYPVWRSRVHSDGSKYQGWFLLGIWTDKGDQITYHLPARRWVDCYFAKTLKRAPEFDGHSSSDVLERLKSQ